MCITHLRRPDLLVLAGQQHGGDAHQLQVAPGDGHDGQVAVDEVDRQEQGLRHQLELEVHLHQPVHQDGPHLVVNVRLVGHVGGAHGGGALHPVVVAVDAVHILCGRGRGGGSRSDVSLHILDDASSAGHAPRTPPAGCPCPPCQCRGSPPPPSGSHNRSATALRTVIKATPDAHAPPTASAAAWTGCGSRPAVASGHRAGHGGGVRRPGAGPRVHGAAAATQAAGGLEGREEEAG